MRFKFFILALSLVGLLLAAMPVVADQPGGAQDPFGGAPVVGGVGVVDGELTIKTTLVPGGNPSRASGDGTSPRKAINISGGWGPGDPPAELSNCGTLRIPAGNARWFKLETFENRRVRIWLDDELDNATKPSGSAVFGAANVYMWGTAAGDAWQTNAYQTEFGGFKDGFVMAIFDPDNLQPNFAYAAPNAAILTFDTDAKGLLQNNRDNLSLEEITGAGIHGYGAHNPHQPSHLLWYEGRHTGWVYVMVYNQMIWDGTASVCSVRVW